jgi:hypothetical protein
LGYVELSNKLKHSNHNGQSSLNTYDKMYSCETAGGTKAIETALPEHHVQSIELQTYDKNEEHVTHHGPVEHFEPEGGGCESWDKT